MSRGTKVDKLYATLRDYSSAAGSAVRLVTIDEVDILAEYFSKHMGAQLADAFGAKPVTATKIAMMQFDKDQMAQQIYDGDKALADLCVSHGMTKGDLPMQWLDATLAAGLKAAKELRDERKACAEHARASRPPEVLADAIREAADKLKGQGYNTAVCQILALLDKDGA